MASSCKGRGFCPSCTGRRMNATAANLIERVLPPESGLRQWVLTFPFSWRRRLAQDGAIARPAHAHRRRDGADVLRRPCCAGGRARGKGRRGHRGAEDFVRPLIESAPPHDRPRWRLARAIRRARLGGARAPWDERSGRGAGAPGPAHGETPSPERTASEKCVVTARASRNACTTSVRARTMIAIRKSVEPTLWRLRRRSAEWRGGGALAHSALAASSHKLQATKTSGRSCTPLHLSWLSVPVVTSY